VASKVCIYYLLYNCSVASPKTAIQESLAQHFYQTSHNTPTTKTTATDTNTEPPPIFIPALFFEAVAEAAVELVVVIEVTLFVEVGGHPTIEVPEIDCWSAAAVAVKDAIVIVLVYEGSNVSTVTTADGYAVNAFPAVLDKSSVPGTPVGRLRGL
jgi:hypothetical protein